MGTATNVTAEWHPFSSAEARDRFTAYFDAEAASWPLETERIMVPTEHGETCVWATGAEVAPPPLLQPGVWGHSLMWPPRLIEMLSAEYRVLAVDNICDVGGSVAVRQLQTADEFCGWLDALLDGLGYADGVSMMGLSRGAWLTAEYLLRSPQRVAKAVWLSPPLIAYGPKLSSMTGMPVSMYALWRPSVSSVYRLMHWLMPDWERSDKAGFDKYVADTALCLQCFDRSKTCGYFGPRVFSEQELARIEVPVLYIAGAGELMSPVEKAAGRLAEVAPRVERRVIPTGGHDVVQVRTEDVAEAMVRFLGGRSA